MTREGHGEMTPWEEVALKQRERGRGQRKRKVENESRREGRSWGPDIGVQLPMTWEYFPKKSLIDFKF